MASCGLELFDEKKEVEVNDEYCLDNIVAFCSKRKQMSAPSSEGLITCDKDSNDVDRRTKIVYSDSKFCYASYYVLSQVTAKLKNGKHGVGSCAEVAKEGKNKGRYWLTCAHNLAHYSVRVKRLVPYTDFRIHKARQGEGEKRSTEVLLGDDKNVCIHPKYNGQPDCGFDIGLIPAGKTISEPDNSASLWSLENMGDNFFDVVWCHANPDNIKKGMSVELAGFPGEKHGWPHTHKGKVVDVTKTPLGGHILWYDADATPGNSGSCVMITDKDFIKSVDDRGNIKKVIVAVHTGHCVAENLNYGTLITSSIWEWIEKS